VDIMTTPDFAAAGTALAACFVDVRTRRIPNALTLGAAAIGVASATWSGGAAGALTSGAGWIAGLALFLPFFLLGGMGGGDVKLLGALGAWLGPADIVWVALYGSLAGGVLAAFSACAHGYARTLWRNLALLILHWRANGVRPLDTITLETSEGPRLAYALPVAIGVLCVCWFQ
jgi:prepilin peptidase CpaA